jgi:hydroxypyruvate isomerase
MAHFISHRTSTNKRRQVNSMTRYSLSLSFFFTDQPLENRIARAAQAGFKAVEFFWPQETSFSSIKNALNRHEVELALFNMNEGNYLRGERGFASDPDQVGRWRSSLDQALELAALTSCPNVNVLTGDWINGVPKMKQMETLTENLAWAAPRAFEAGTRLLIEPLNVVTHPNFVCTTTHKSVEIIEAVRNHGQNLENILLQFDVYQVARGEGNIVASLKDLMPRIGHIQIADSPDRGEPGTGELNYEYILTEIDRAGYQGFVGLEYKPPTATSDHDLFEWIRHMTPDFGVTKSDA